jgi:hypothetical protein
VEVPWIAPLGAVEWVEVPWIAPLGAWSGESPVGGAVGGVGGVGGWA